MLVLTRKTEESIRIGENVTITVLSIKGNRVRLGIAAPQDTKILRTEVEFIEEPAKLLSPAPVKSIIPPLSAFITSTTFASA